MVELTKIPWKAIHRLGYQFRRQFFSVSKPNEPHLIVDSNVEELRRIFRTEHYREGWILSYHYKGEDANVSRAEFEDDKWEDYQHHIRLFEREDGRVELFTHYELDAIQHPKGHIKEINYDNERGLAMSRKVLDDYGVEYEEA